MSRYRFGFALTTALGNQTRYANLRKYVDQDTEVEATWCPITHYLEPDPYARWPGPVHDQRILNHQAADILDQWTTLDAVVVHAFQLFAFLSLRRRRSGRPLLALYQDYAPFRDLTMLQQYGQEVQDDRRRRARFRMQSWFSRRADVCIAWTDWAARSFIDDCGVDALQVHVINPGVDLELWPASEPEVQDDRPVRVLFVGGDFVRKGGEVLLEAHRELAVRSDVDVELDIVTREGAAVAGPGVRVHTGLQPNDGRIRDLFRRCDLLVLPTHAEMAGLVLVEAMATGRPVVATPVGGVPDLVEDGVTGVLVEPGDHVALAETIGRLARDPELRGRMGRAGRVRVEEHFDAGANASRMLTVLKNEVDSRREGHQAFSRTRWGGR